MNCELIRQQMIESLNEPQGRELSADLAEHLAQCADCASAAAEIRDMHIRLLSAANAAGERSIVDQVMQCIAEKPPRHFTARRRIGWLVAACAALAIGVWLAIFFATSSVTFAQVKQALATQSWYHVRYDCGRAREMWSSPSQGKSYWIDFDGEVWFVDDQHNLRQVYSPADGSISQDQPAIYTDGVVPQWKPSTVAEEWSAICDRMSKHPADCERHDETIDGRQTVRFDCYSTDRMGTRTMFSQFWIDAETHLPVKERERLQPAEQEKSGREWQTGEFDFPTDGPRDIYQLGVPKNAPIDSEDDIAPQVRDLINCSKIEVSKFPQEYRAVCWDDSKDSMINIVYQFGNKARLEQYQRRSLPDLAEPNHTPLVEPLNEEKVLEWAKTQTPADVALLDGQHEYWRRNYFQPPATQPQIRVSSQSQQDRSDLHLWTPGDRPAEMMWPFLNIGGPAEMLEKNDDTPPGCVGFRVGGHGNFRHDYYLDPTKDLACVKMISWEKRGDKFEKTREGILLDFHQVDGRWCPGKHYVHDYGNKARGIWPFESVSIIAVTELKESDLPANLFDSSDVLHGAKVDGY
jgi:hypothetical protein